MWTVLWFLIYTICACMHTSLYIIYVYSQKICICMCCFPARTSGSCICSIICSYCIICKAPLFPDWKTWLVPPPRVWMDARCIHALSHLGCYYSTSQNRKLISYTTILNLSMNIRDTTFLTCFGASARIICSVSKTPSFLPIQVLYNCTWTLLYVYPEGLGDLHACILMLQQYNTLYMYIKNERQ